MDAGMVFGIIFTIFVMGIILVFGWDQISNFLGFGVKAQISRELESIKQKVDKVYNMAENSEESHTLSISSPNKICFFNSSNPSARIYSDDSISWKPDPVYRTLIKNEGYNTWYYAGDTKNGYTIPKLDMPTDKNFCAPGGSKIYIIRMYDGVEIEPA
jgi:hypothetical protein